MSATESIHVTIPPRLYQVPAAALFAGTLIGAVRGSRQESLRFLAENAHRAPRTIKGWYFYNKTKNYRLMLAGLREGGRDAGKLGITALGWVTIEEWIKKMGMPEAAEIGAGVGTGALFGAVYRLAMHTTGRATILGLSIGIGMFGLRKSRERLTTMAAEIPSGTSEGVEQRLQSD